MVFPRTMQEIRASRIFAEVLESAPEEIRCPYLRIKGQGGGTRVFCGVLHDSFLDSLEASGVSLADYEAVSPDLPRGGSSLETAEFQLWCCSNDGPEDYKKCISYAQHEQKKRLKK